MWRLVSGQKERIVQQYAYYLEQTIEADIQPQRALLQNLLRELKAVCQALVQNPIHADSGEEEIVYRPGPGRTFADMQGEIATRLANPTLPYTARAKLGTQEYTIQALPFRQPDADSVWMPRRERIIDQTRKYYCRKRDEVDSEVTARQNALTQSAQSPQNQPPPRRGQAPGGLKTCQQCGTAAPWSGAQFCAQCGSPL